MPRSLGKHDVVKHEDQGLIRPNSGTRVSSSRRMPAIECRRGALDSGGIGRSSAGMVRLDPIESKKYPRSKEEGDGDPPWDNP